MSKVFVPSYENNNCLVIQNNNTIRVYDNRPTQNSNVHYKDYYINSHYLEVEGTQNFSQYATLPVCMNSNNITTEYFYRSDFMEILVIFLIMCYFIFLLPLKVIFRLFKRVRL